MLELQIREKGCRGCRFCVDVCPTEAIAFDDAMQKAVVASADDCIECLSCAYLCPSGAIIHRGHHLVKNFYRNLYFSRRMEKFL